MSTNPLSSQNGATQPPRPTGRGAQLDPLRVIREYAWIFAGTFTSSIFIGVILYVVLLFFAPKFTTEVLLRVTGGITDPYQGVQNSGQMGQTRMDLLEAYIKNQTIRIRSNDVMNEVLKRDTVRQTAWYSQFNNSTVDAREDLQNLLRVSQIRGSTLISVRLTGSYKQEMVVILEEVIDEYLRKMRIETGQESDKVRMTFVRERTEAERDLTRAREEMEQFASQYDLTNLQTRGSEAQVTFQLLADQMTKVIMALSESRASYEGLTQAQQSGQITRSANELAEVEFDHAISSRNERLRSIREQREVVLQRLGENHRSVVEMDRLYRATEQEKNREIERLLRERQEIRLEQSKRLFEALQGQAASLQPKLEEARERMRDLNRNLQRYHHIEDRANAANVRRARAEESLTRARLQSERPDSTRIQRVTPATEAKMTFPVPYFVIPGVTVLMTGLVAGFVFLKEFMDQRVKSPADIKALPGCTLLGVLPEASDDPSGSGTIHNAVMSDPTGLFAEGFRGIRTALLAQLDRHGYKTLMVVGAQAGCGASCVAANLATSLAANERRVLVIDANLRRPDQHVIFGIESEPGLAEVLTGTAEFEQAVVRVEAAGIDVLPVGHGDNATPELLEGAALRKLLGVLVRRYDLILIDVAPALLTSEARQLAKQVDAVALVVRAMADMRGMVERMVQQFDNQRAQVMGIILNGVRSSAGGYFKKNYEEFYKYRRDVSGNGSSSVAHHNGTRTDDSWPTDGTQAEPPRLDETSPTQDPPS